MKLVEALEALWSNLPADEVAAKRLFADLKTASLKTDVQDFLDLFHTAFTVSPPTAGGATVIEPVTLKGS
jgi:hypothetical protein